MTKRHLTNEISSVTETDQGGANEACSTPVLSAYEHNAARTTVYKSTEYWNCSTMSNVAAMKNPAVIQYSSMRVY